MRNRAGRLPDRRLGRAANASRDLPLHWVLLRLARTLLFRENRHVFTWHQAVSIAGG